MPSALQLRVLTRSSPAVVIAGRSRVVPAPAVRADQHVGRERTPAAGGVRLEARGAVAPALLDYVDEPPGGLDLVRTGEQGGIPEHAVDQQALVGVGSIHQE